MNTGDARRPRVMLLTPVYNEEDSLPVYEQEVTRVLMSREDAEYSVLFIDDGSSDRSWELIEAIAARSPRFSGIRLSRNFGSHIALSAGFEHADGDAIATLACDLQDPPTVILEFVERWRAGAQIVWGRRRTRDEEAWRIWASRLFSGLIGRYAMPRGSRFTTGSFLLADRRVAECVRQYREQNRIVFALVAWTGFKQDVVEYDRRRRERGVSGWSYLKMIKTMYDAFIGFSLAPVRLMSLLGMVMFVFTIPLAAYLVYEWVVGEPLRGWTSIMLTIALLFGVQFLLLGIVGEYLYRIYAESVRRPLYFVSDETRDVVLGDPAGSVMHAGHDAG